MTNYHHYQHSQQYSQYPQLSNQGSQINPYYVHYPQQQHIHQNYYYTQQQRTVQMMQRAPSGVQHLNAPFQYSTSPWPTLPNAFQQQSQQGWKPMQPLPVTQISKELTVTQKTVYPKNLDDFQFMNDLKRKGVDQGSSSEFKRSRISEVPTSSETPSEVLSATAQFYSKSSQLSEASSETFTKFWDSVLQQDDLQVHPTSSQPVAESFRGSKTATQSVDLVNHPKKFTRCTLGPSKDGWREFTVPQEEDPEITVLAVLKGASSGASRTVLQPKAPYSFSEPSQLSGAQSGASSGTFVNSRSIGFWSESLGAQSGAFNSPMNPGSTFLQPKASYGFWEPSESSGVFSGASDLFTMSNNVYISSGQMATEDPKTTVDAPRAPQSYTYPEPVNASEAAQTEAQQSETAPDASKDSEITVAQLEADGQDPKDILDLAKDDEWSFDAETDEEFLARFFQPKEK